MDPHFAEAHSDLGMAYAEQGAFEDAAAELRKAIDLSGGRSVMIATHGHIQARASNRAEATRTIDELNQLSAWVHVSPLRFALVYAGLEERMLPLNGSKKPIKKAPPSWCTSE